ncbi:hypothetical protein, partial [Halorubrum sp. Atlit-28R]|uniref:hypothetical protein n=1 Tax=Halorubrum sp. Atlit-28R TaxID=2282129 RepID=UPI001F2C0934
VLPEKDLRVIPGVVEHEAAKECEHLEKAHYPRPYYRIQLTQGTADSFDIDVLILRAQPAFRRNNEKLIASPSTSKAAYEFRECTSLEGSHLLVSSVTRGRTKRIWHSYYYFGYDIVPTCTSDDFKAMKIINMSLKPVAQGRW